MQKSGNGNPHSSISDPEKQQQTGFSFENEIKARKQSNNQIVQTLTQDSVRPSIDPDDVSRNERGVIIPQIQTVPPPDIENSMPYVRQIRSTESASNKYNFNLEMYDTFMQDSEEQKANPVQELVAGSQHAAGLDRPEKNQKLSSVINRQIFNNF